MESKIAILTAHSLLADGLISRLHDYPEAAELKVFNGQEPDVLNQLIAFKPQVLILEEEETQSSNTVSLKQILAILPTLLVIYLHLGRPEVQVIQSEQCPAPGVKELLEIIRLSSGHPAWAMVNHVVG
jgi:DNA polymerase/3'-5' exonuclease PolX